MSGENVELYRRGVEAYNRQDLDGFLELMREDVEAVSRLAALEGAYHGHAGIRRWWENLFDVLPDTAIEILEVRDLGDLTLGVIRLHGHGAGSETPFEQLTWQLVEWRDGACTYWEVFTTEAEAVEAAGHRVGRLG